jgi:glutathione S-transferase
MTEDANIRTQLLGQFQVIDTVAIHYFHFIRGEPLDTQYAEMRDALRLLNDKYLAGGRPFAHELVGYENRVSVGDILLLPFVERLEANRGLIYGKEVLAQDLSNVWAWLQRMNTQGWYAQFKQLPRYFQKAVERSRVVGGHLTLPVTIYH